MLRFFGVLYPTILRGLRPRTPAELVPQRFARNASETYHSSFLISHFSFLILQSDMATKELAQLAKQASIPLSDCDLETRNRAL
ncbi:MAG: hypothetical protein IKR13_00175, partial [Victivallales bacterium]|nr:hypothetical protein [Victivallales bacterium]